MNTTTVTASDIAALTLTLSRFERGSRVVECSREPSGAVLVFFGFCGTGERGADDETFRCLRHGHYKSDRGAAKAANEFLAKAFDA